GGLAGGGGGLQLGGAFPLIENCHVYANEATLGGGILFNLGAMGTLRNCVLTANESSGRAGAIHLTSDSKPLLESCTIVGNITNDQGTILIDDSSPVFRNCVITGNVAKNGNSVAHIQGTGGLAKPTFNNCTIADNVVSGTGGSNTGFNIEGSGTEVTLRNC